MVALEERLESSAGTPASMILISRRVYTPACSRSYYPANQVLLASYVMHWYHSWANFSHLSIIILAYPLDVEYSEWLCSLSQESTFVRVFSVTKIFYMQDALIEGLFQNNWISCLQFILSKERPKLVYEFFWKNIEKVCFFFFKLSLNSWR